MDLYRFRYKRFTILSEATLSPLSKDEYNIATGFSLTIYNKPRLFLRTTISKYCLIKYYLIFNNCLYAVIKYKVNDKYCVVYMRIERHTIIKYNRVKTLRFSTEYGKIF